MNKTVVVFTSDMARKLLRRGYSIVDIKQDKFDQDGKRSIFFFKNENGIEESIKELIPKK
jgi:hypothetical protein